MSVISFVDANKAATISRPAQQLPSSFTDLVGMAYNQTRLNFNSDSARMAENDAREEQARLYQEATGNDISELRNSDEYKTRTISPWNRYNDRDLDKEIERLKQDPIQAEILKHVPTGEALDGLARGIAQLSDEELKAAEYFSNSNWIGTAGFIGGGASGFTDPIVLATIPFGASAGSTAIRTIGTEMALSVAADIAVQPMVAKWQHELGNEYGMSDAMATTLLSATMAGGVAGVISGATRKTRARIRDNIKAREDAIARDAEAEALKVEMEVLRSFDPIQPREYVTSYDVTVNGKQTNAAFTNYTLLGANKELPDGLRSDLRAIADDIHNRQQLPIDAPTVEEMRIHKGNMNVAQKAYEAKSFVSMPLKDIAFSRFVEIDTHAHADMARRYRELGNPEWDKKAAREIVLDHIKEGLEKERVLLASNTLSKQEVSDLKREISRVENQINGIQRFDDMDYTTSGRGARGDAFDTNISRGELNQLADQTRKQAEADQLENKLQATLDTLNDKLDANNNKVQRANDIRRVLQGKDEPASITKLFDEIVDSINRINRERTELALEGVSSNTFVQWEQQAMDLLPQPIRTAKQIDEEIAVLDTPRVQEQTVADFDALPDNAQIFDEHGNISTVGKMREDMAEVDRVNQEIASCGVGGKA